MAECEAVMLVPVRVGMMVLKMVEMMADKSERKLVDK